MAKVMLIGVPAILSCFSKILSCIYRYDCMIMMLSYLLITKIEKKRKEKKRKEKKRLGHLT
jgi:hypothetical protein